MSAHEGFVIAAWLLAAVLFAGMVGAAVLRQARARRQLAALEALPTGRRARG